MKVVFYKRLSRFVSELPEKDISGVVVVQCGQLKVKQTDIVLEKRWN